MKALFIRASSSERLARVFLQRFCAAEFAKAAALTCTSFHWFGQTLEPGDWTSPAIRRFGKSHFTALRPIPSDLQACLPAGALGGAANDELLFLFDLKRGPRTVTAALGVRGDRVRRVFDPVDIRVALRKLAS